MNDQEKSALLAKVKGWTVAVAHRQYTAELVIIDGAKAIGEGTLYSPSNMALAWQVHLWMLDREQPHLPRSILSQAPLYNLWWSTWGLWLKEDMQRVMLDKILSLLIKDGTV